MSKAFGKLTAALAPLEAWAQKQMTPNAQIVAKNAGPIFIAASTTILRWPDRSQAISYIQGFKIIGEVDRTGVFRSIKSQEAEETEFYGEE